MPIHIFPYALVRYAGADFRDFDSFELSETPDLLKEYLQWHTVLEQQKNSVCESLYRYIPQAEEAHRQHLIDLKRQLFNNRPVPEEKLSYIYGVIPTPLQSVLRTYFREQEAFSLFRTEGIHAFGRKLENDRRDLQHLSRGTVLQHGLLLSSPILRQQLSGYTRRSPSAFRQKDLRIEFSVLRYLTRSAFKTSPFSTFTYTGVAELSDTVEIGNPGASPQDRDIRNTGSRLRLNNYLFVYLNTLWLHHAELNELLHIKLNQTVRIRDDKIRFLVNFNNIEAFQQIPASGLPLYIIRYLQQTGNTLTLGALTDHIGNTLGDTTRAAVKTYLFRLIKAGLLQAGTSISGIDPDWHTRIIRFLKDTGNRSASVMALRQLFTDLEQCCTMYPDADSDQRQDLLKTAEEQINTTLGELETSGGLTSSEDRRDTEDTHRFEKSDFSTFRFSQKQLFYEDCYTTGKEVLPEKVTAPVIEKTDELLNFLLPMDLMQKERTKMLDFFRTRYPLGQQVNIMDFYEAYYLEVRKPEKEQAARGIKPADEETPWDKELLRRMVRHTRNRPEELELNRDFFAGLPISGNLVPGKRYSRGMFVQFYTAKAGALHGVVNTILPGMGKVSGRFLGLFGREITDRFVAYNTRLSPVVQQAELNDASGFNANIHPRLLHYEVSLPGGNSSYPEDSRIPLTELYVGYNPDTGKLELLRNSKPLYTYDLCLESFYNRSNLYQMLAHFNPEARLSLKSLIRLVDLQYDRPGKMPECLVLPRITYAGNVIVRRKTWQVQTAAVPQQHDETDFDYYLRLNAWRQQCGIPETVFLFLRKRSIVVSPAPHQETVKHSPDDYKPQYISFTSPLLVEMLKKLLSRAGAYISMEEVLPAIPREQKHPETAVKEYLIQWYNY